MDSSMRPYQLGGLSFLASGAFFLAKSALELYIGPPPSSGAEILAWAAEGRYALMMFSEILFFATALMVPAFAALYRALAPSHPQQSTIGCGLAALAIPIFAFVIIVHGRLMYPVFGIQVHTPEVAELVVAITYGGLHAVALVMAIATFTLSLALRESARTVAVLGFATAAADVVASYPDIIGPWPTFICGAFFAAWFGAVGLWLLRGASARGERRLSPFSSS